MKKMLIVLVSLVLVVSGYLLYVVVSEPVESVPVSHSDGNAGVEKRLIETPSPEEQAKLDLQDRAKETRRKQVADKVKTVLPKVVETEFSVPDISDEDFVEFRVAFNALTDEEKEEETRRGVVEWEDDRYPILAKLMMDSSQPKDVLQLLYDDLRSRDVDKIRVPMLKRLAAAKDHPFSSDASEELKAQTSIGE